VARQTYLLTGALSGMIGGPGRANIVGNAKIVLENMKSIMAAVKSTIPALLGSEITEEEENEILSETLTLIQDVQTRFNRMPPPIFSGAQKESMRALLETIVVEMNGIGEILRSPQNKPPPPSPKGPPAGASPVGIALLSTALMITSAVVDLANVIVSAVDQQNNYLLQLAELMLHYANVVEIVASCKAVRNRIAHQSHLVISLLGLAQAVNLATDPTLYNIR